MRSPKIVGKPLMVADIKITLEGSFLFLGFEERLQ